MRSYEEFAKALQTEMEDQGIAFTKEMVHNERNKVTVRLKKGYAADDNFLRLWDKIRTRTRYRVELFDGEAVVEAAVAAIQQIASLTERPKVIIARADIAITEQRGCEGTEVGRRTQVVEDALR